MTNLSEEVLKFTNDIPHTIFEIAYNIKTDLVKINFLNRTGKLFFKKIIIESAIKDDFKLQEVFSLQDHSEVFIQFSKDLLSTEEIVITNREYLLKTLKGKQILIQVSFTAKKDKENVIIRGLLCEKSEIIKREIPKSKLDQYKIMEDEVENLKDFFTAFDAIIMILNEEGRILFISPNVGDDILYRPKEQIIGKTLIEIFPKGQAEFFLQQINEVFRKGEAISFEYHLPIENKLLWFQCRIIPVHIKDGKFTQTVAIIRDITKWRLKPIADDN
ncbi:MAG: PAS domain-containing protein [Candidatus Heimdallarchaeota archaeon]